MKFDTLLQLLGQETVFSTGLLLAGNNNRAGIRLQLDRWDKSGKIIRLRRGLYALAAPYAKTSLHPFHLAYRLQPASYVSLQSALSFYGMIPEHVPVTTAVTAGRPKEYTTPLGVFTFRHIKPGLFNGYTDVTVTGQQQAFIATPEKALLDLLYLTPNSDTAIFLRELRLQNTGQLHLDKLKMMITETGSPKLTRTYGLLLNVINEEELETL